MKSNSYRGRIFSLQRILVSLLACLYSTTLFAQLNLKVEISGIDTVLEENVRLFLSIQQQKTHTLLSEARLRRLHRKAEQEISQALQPFGYYRPVIKSELTQPMPNQWLANYSITPGPALPVGQFNFSISGEMNTDPEFIDLIQNFSLKKGVTFNHIEYEKIKASLARLAAERGYFSARFSEHRVEIDLNAYEARVKLHYDGGPRYRFGEVLLTQDVLDPELLQRYISFKKGDHYTLKHLLDLQQALNDTDYFQTVEVSPAQAQPGSKEIPIRVMLTPRKPHRYSFGLGYGTDTGARAKFAWEVTRLNRRGHRFDSEAKISKIGYSLSAHYRVPTLNPRTDQLVYNAGIINEKTDTSDSTVRTVGASLNRGRGAWRETVSLNYQQEEYVVAEDHGVSTLLMPSVSWSRTWGENFIYTLKGLRFDLSLRGASNNLLSDTDFSQLQSGLKTITPLGSRDRILLRGRLGYTWTKEFHQLPSSVRFFAGGARSVRGYAYHSLGPLDENGKVEGGQHLMVGSVELEHSLNGKWGIALFYDGGNAINSFSDQLEKGAGFGLRWQSPVGPIRIDLASAVTRDGTPWRLHLNIGPDL